MRSVTGGWGALVLAAALAWPPSTAARVVWSVDDDRPIPEPAEDEEGDLIWWDGTRNMTVYQIGKVFDLNHSLRAVGQWMGLAGPREAVDVNALDEVPDSTWFTNRHGRERLSAAELARGPNTGPPPASEGPLRVVSGKALGQTPGFTIEDAGGHRYIVKVDPPDYPELTTGAEIVCQKILHALGWNVPEYHLLLLDPARLEIAPDATVKNAYGEKRPMTRVDLVEGTLRRAAKRPDGRYRVLASRFIPGKPKGPFRTLGIRPDDPNDTIPHQDRRELRGLRVAAAWVDYTDARRGNFYDAFVRDPGDAEGMGHLVHYLLDFSSAFGAGNVGVKSPKDGEEYFFDPPVVLKSTLALGFWIKPWEDPPPVEHPAVGTFESEIFDPERWRTTYPQPLFDAATALDLFWGARLVASFTEADIRTVVATGEWSSPEAGREIVRILRERQEKIVRTWMDPDRVNPIGWFRVRSGRLELRDRRVELGIVPSGLYRYRYEGTRWQETETPAVPGAPGRVEISTSHDRGKTWSPSTFVRIDEAGRVAEIVRDSR